MNPYSTYGLPAGYGVPAGVPPPTVPPGVPPAAVPGQAIPSPYVQPLGGAAGVNTHLLPSPRLSDSTKTMTLSDVSACRFAGCARSERSSHCCSAAAGCCAAGCRRSSSVRAGSAASRGPGGCGAAAASTWHLRRALFVSRETPPFSWHSESFYAALWIGPCRQRHAHAAITRVVGLLQRSV